MQDMKSRKLRALTVEGDNAFGNNDGNQPSVGTDEAGGRLKPIHPACTDRPPPEQSQASGEDKKKKEEFGTPSLAPAFLTHVR